MGNEHGAVEGDWARTGRGPFGGSITPARIPLFAPGRGTLPFPHPWNYQRPLDILAAYYWRAERDTGATRHTRYLKVPGFRPVLVTRDPRLIRAISAETGDKPGQFDRDTMPSSGIARATGEDTLLYANGAAWKAQKRLAAPPFSRGSLFQPEQFHEFERTFRATVAERLERVRAAVGASGGPLRVQLEPEIKAIMLEMLVNNFFGAQVPYQRIREHFVPALERVIDHIVRDTIMAKLGLPLSRLPAITPGLRRARESAAVFEELTDIVIATRKEKCGAWRQFESEAPDAALRANIRVFLAGALEATTSYASWALAHLARHAEAQERLYAQVRDVDEYTPGTLAAAKYLNHVLNETLRLTPALYFHPRRATVDTTVETGGGDTLTIPAGTHILLDIWHANRHEDHWGVGVTGFAADRFEPDRWETIARGDRNATDLMHFGFGHGPRFCPGKNLGELEVALVVGACIKMFRLEAPTAACPAKAAVSTKPADGVLVDLYLRTLRPQPAAGSAPSAAPPVGPVPARCPFAAGQDRQKS